MKKKINKSRQWGLNCKNNTINLDWNMKLKTNKTLPKRPMKKLKL